MTANLYEERSRILLGIVIFVALILLARLFFIQVLNKEYRELAEQTALKRETVYPARGLILDRENRNLVQNEILYDLVVTESKMKNFDTSSFLSLLDLTKQEFDDAFAKARKSIGYARYKPYPIIRQLSKEQYGRLQERLYQYRGVIVQPRSARSYPQPMAAHAIGYLGEVNNKEISADSLHYRMGDLIGKTGLEYQYESVLRGQKGYRLVLRDQLNREVGPYQNGLLDSAATPGKNIITGIDKDLQAYAEKLLKGKLGSIVAIEPATGEILALASAPDYNPNDLQGRARAKNYGKLVMHPNKPMFNRAISAMYPPGSTLKPVEALMAMGDNLIDSGYTYTCSGGYRVGGHVVGCHSAGTFNVHHSIRLSCNSYYCHLFKLMVDGAPTPAQGLTNWKEGLASFGSGILTGIDVPNEKAGIVPSPELYDRVYRKGAWKASTIISLGIGQAEISLTPLQLANNVAVIANRGYYITPHFVRAIGKDDDYEMLKYERHETGIKHAYMEVVARAMQDVVDAGTARMARIPGVKVGGKTGTAQNPHGEDHSLFIGFAPLDTPKIAIAVVIENAGYGGTWAAPAASLIMEMYLKDSLSNTYRKNVEKWVLDAAYLKKKEEKKDEEGDKEQDKQRKEDEEKDNDAAATQQAAVKVEEED